MHSSPVGSERIMRIMKGMTPHPGPRRNNCVILCRVSSTKQMHDGESLEQQEAHCRRIAEHNCWAVVPDDRVWSTQISGWKDARTDYEAMTDFIKEHPGLVQYCVFRSIDRFTRAGMEAYARMKRELADLKVEMVDTAGIIQPTKNTLEHLGVEYTWSRYSPSEITEAVIATTSKQEINTILTRMIGQAIVNTRKGYRTRRPTDGFLNKKIIDPEGKKKYIQVPDPKREKYRVAMYELRNQGLSDAECVERINAMGYRSPVYDRWNTEKNRVVGTRGGTPMTIKQFQRDIQNTLYAGVVCEKWTHFQPIKAQYPGLVSIDVWNRANRGKVAIMEKGDGALALVHGKASPTAGRRNPFNPLFPYKFVRCPFCNKPFLGSESRGKLGRKYPAYHCARGHARIGVSKKTFDEAVERYIKHLKFNTDILNGLEVTLLNKYYQRAGEIVAASGDIHTTIGELKAEQAAKLKAYVASRSEVVRGMLENEIEELNQHIKTAGTQRLKIQIQEHDIKRYIKEARHVMEHPSELLLNPVDSYSQRALFELVFESMPTYNEIINGTPKLSLVFALSSEFVADKSQLVSPEGLEWNTLEGQILKWKSVFAALHPAYLAHSIAA